MTRVIHTGDTHLGYQQYHVPERRRDFLAAFRQVVEDAVEDDVAAVVHAGDLFHDRNPTLTDILGTIEVLETLDEADVPFLAVVGNHESKRDAQWLDLFESLGLATRLGDEPVVVGNTAFYGLDFVPRSRRDDVEFTFEPHDAEFAALVTHGLFKPFDHGDWDAREIIGGSPVAFDALLLGDDHAADTARVEDTWLTYCGSTERTAADEREPRGYNVVTFDDDVGIARRGLDTREFVYCEIDVAADEGVDRVRERVGQYDLEDAVVVVHVDGEGDPLTPASVEQHALDEGALVARVTDHRELADEREREVNFADPDEAVRERVRELGLSDAARDVDETIRASKVADSNVADEVESRVRDLVDDGEWSAFEAAEAPPDESTDDAAGGTTEPEPIGEPAGADADGAAGAADGGVGDEPDGDSEPAGASNGGGAGESTPESATADETAPESGGSDGQASMEEYL